MPRKKKAEEKPKSKRGGKRAGAGRKPSAVVAARAEVLAATGTREAAEKAQALIVGVVERCVKNLVTLADGGFERAERRFERAGSITVRAPVRRPDGTLEYDPRGRVVIAEQPAFPEKPADEMVLTGLTICVAEPDRGANIDLLNRILGRPATAEPKAEERDRPLPEVLEEALNRAYGGPDTP